MSAPPRIAFAGSKTTTLECMEAFVRDGFSADLLVTLTPEAGSRHQVAGYRDLRPFAAERELRTYHPESYALTEEADRRALLAERVDCLLVIGWQRLIPEWWLAALTLGAFGMHGSHEPLPRGRGRSPLNWALAWGKRSFQTHLFRYDPGVDSGAVVGVQRFDINHWDDCQTLHFKNRIAMNRLLKKHLPDILAGRGFLQPQPQDIEPTYLPKRTPEHGRIRWLEMDMVGLHDHIRCQTHPFPGAFSHLPGRPGPFHFWRGEPFDTHLTYSGTLPGTVVELFHDSSFLVSVWDGSVRVHDYTAPDGEPPRLGERFVDEEPTRP